MYKICKTDKSVQRQKQFQDTLLAMMEKQGFSNITITALCKEMNAPRKAFYRYFDTLEDVLFAVTDGVLTEAFLHLEVRVDIEGFFNYWKENRSFLDVLEKNGLSPLLVNQIHGRLLQRPLKDGISNKELKYTGYISALMTILISWHHTGMQQSVEEMSTIVKEMFSLD